MNDERVAFSTRLMEQIDEQIDKEKGNCYEAEAAVALTIIIISQREECVRLCVWVRMNRREKVNRLI